MRRRKEETMQPCWPLAPVVGFGALRPREGEEGFDRRLSGAAPAKGGGGRGMLISQTSDRQLDVSGPWADSCYSPRTRT
eukprot:5158988-Pyramimonas_sp.AAC.1